MRARTAPSNDQFQDVLSFLTEFSRLLMAAGFSSGQFNQLAELAFFRAASDEARFRNSRINQSSVAAMTGLNRSRIRALVRAEKKKSHLPAEDRREKLLVAWMSEPEFLTPLGEPRRLKVVGKKGSFGALAQRHGGDIPPKALLRDLLRRRLVRVSDGYVYLQSNAREVTGAKRVEQVAGALSLAMRLPSGASNRRAMKVMSFEVKHSAPSAIGRILLQRRISKSLRGFMAELDAACNAIALDAPAKTPQSKRMGKTAVVLMTQD